MDAFQKREIAITILVIDLLQNNFVLLWKV